MNASSKIDIYLKIIYASLIAIGIQYLADIASAMSVALLPENVTPYLRYTLLSVVCVGSTVLMLLPVMRNIYSIPLRAVNPEFSLRGVVCGIVAALGIFVVAIVAYLPLHPDFMVVPSDKMAVMLFDGVVCKGFATAVSEELIFRGFLLAYMMSVLGRKRAVIWSTIVFVFPHLLVFDGILPILLNAVTYMAVTLVITELYLLTRSLWAAISMHATYNFCTLLIGPSSDCEANIITLLTDISYPDLLFMGVATAVCIAEIFIMRHNAPNSATEL